MLTRVSSASVCAIASAAVLLVGPTWAHAKCIASTDAIAGILRKVTIRDPESRELVTNWHIATSEPICVKVDDVTWSNQSDIQVEFKAGVDLVDVDQSLGFLFAVKGKIVGYRGGRDTGDIIVTEAEIFTDVDDAGEIRR